MKKVCFVLLLALLFNSCPVDENHEDTGLTSGSGGTADHEYIIADSSVVDDFDSIPAEYMNKVKTMLVDIAGESHSAAYRTGVDRIASAYPTFAAVSFDGTFPAVTDEHLRLGRHGSTGEEEFFTNPDGIQAMKNIIAAAETDGNPIHVFGLGWCWDMDRGTATTERDPVHDVGWAGSSNGGPQGDLSWGLDAEDQAITGNSVCMDTYLAAVNEYNEYARANGYQCVTIFTTGPVDTYNGEVRGFQREIKHEYIRNHVKQGNGRILFDYADILCYNDAGEYKTWDWNDGGTLRTHAGIHPDNDAEETGHIGFTGSERLAKAMWWMLARIAGWDGT